MNKYKWLEFEKRDKMDKKKTNENKKMPDHYEIIPTDYPKREDVCKLLKKMDIKPREELPDSINHKKWCSPVKDQGNLNSGSAFAGSGMIEYYENLVSDGKYVDSSNLFLYKVTRNLLNVKGNISVLPSAIMGAMVLFGIPPEKYWPYTDNLGDIIPYGFDNEPPAFCYSLAQNFKVIQYLKIDQPGISRDKFLEVMKINLSEGFPLIFEFDVYESVEQGVVSGLIPYPQKDERLELLNHGVMAVGYDDSVKVQNTNSNEETEGAILFKNSWSAKWGDNGYGWLPYEYFLKGCANDCWSLLQCNWIDIDAFKV